MKILDRPGRSRRRRLGFGVVGVAALLLTGCGFPGVSNGSSDSSAPYRLDSSAESMVPDGGLSPSEGSETGDDVGPDRSVVTTGWMQVTVDDPIDAAAQAAEIVLRTGGRIDSRTEQPATDTQKATASLTIRIPAVVLDDTLEQIKDLGMLNSISVNATDVTLQVTDVAARIQVLEASIDRLTQLMAAATSTSDLITVEQALSERQAELDSLVSQRDYLSDQVDLSTVTVELVAEGVVAPGTPDDFWSGLVAGWNSVLAALSGFIVVAGVAVPWLGVLAVIGLIVWGVIALSTRKNRGPKLDE